MGSSDGGSDSASPPLVTLALALYTSRLFVFDGGRSRRPVVYTGFGVNVIIVGSGGGGPVPAVVSFLWASNREVRVSWMLETRVKEVMLGRWRWARRIFGIWGDAVLLFLSNGQLELDHVVLHASYAGQLCAIGVDLVVSDSSAIMVMMSGHVTLFISRVVVALTIKHCVIGRTQVNIAKVGLNAALISSLVFPIIHISHLSGTQPSGYKKKKKKTKTSTIMPYH